MQILETIWLSSLDGASAIVVTDNGFEKKIFMGSYNSNMTEELAAQYVAKTGAKIQPQHLKNLLKHFDD